MNCDVVERFFEFISFFCEFCSCPAQTIRRQSLKTLSSLFHIIAFGFVRLFSEAPGR